MSDSDIVNDFLAETNENLETSANTSATIASTPPDPSIDAQKKPRKPAPLVIAQYFPYFAGSLQICLHIFSSFFR